VHRTTRLSLFKDIIIFKSQAFWIGGLKLSGLEEKTARNLSASKKHDLQARPDKDSASRREVAAASNPSRRSQA